MEDSEELKSQNEKALPQGKMENLAVGQRKPKNRTRRSYSSMHARCTNKDHVAYNRYGGSGVTICDRWKGKNGFTNFLEDMGERPAQKTLDRINNSLGYSKENCKWSSMREQAINRKTTVFIEYNGVTKCMADWADSLGIPKPTLWSRLRRYKLSIEAAFNKRNRFQYHG